jgi:hypothetical protein
MLHAVAEVRELPKTGASEQGSACNAAALEL